MDLPRIASQTSICPPNIQQLLLPDYHRIIAASSSSSSNPPHIPTVSSIIPRTPFSKRLQQAAVVGGGGNNTTAATGLGANSSTSNNTSTTGPAPAGGVAVCVNGIVASVPGGGPPGLPQQSEPVFPQLSSSSYQPSRRREEALALANLRRRVQPELLGGYHRQQQLLADGVVVTGNNSCEDTLSETAVGVTAGEKDRLDHMGNGSLRRSVESVLLDNRPNLLQKILSNRPVSMILDISDLRTAWQDSDFISDCLCWHNVYRQRHCSPPLMMSSELCHFAQTWANHLAHTNRFYYRNDRDIGQNLFCRPSNSVANDVTGQEVSTYWYSAVRQYDYGKEPDVLHANVNAGHFTQLVWSKSSQFGVGMATSRSGKIVVVAHYSPAGNVTGHFQRNVMPPVLEVPTIPPPPGFQAAPTDSSGGTEDSRSNNTSNS